MTIDPSVFKAYDVRGVYPGEIDEEGAERVGAAFIAVTGAKRIAVGHDVRLSSPSMAAAFTDGALSAGADVTELGLCATEMLYFAVAEGGYDAGACITASHNPPQYTGAKMVTAGAVPLSGDSGIGEVGRIAQAGPPRAAAPGARSTDDGLLGRFVERCMQFIDPSAVHGLRVVFDAANGMSGLYLPPVIERLDIDAVPFFLEPDGRFPNHEPNPLLPENRAFIMAKVREENADLGIAFDGAADRCLRAPGRPPSSTTFAPRGPCATPWRPQAAPRTCTAWATPSSSAACARWTPSSPARSAATTTSRTSRSPTPASCRRCS